MRTLGRYTLRAELGRGGMGAVFHGFDSTLERDVAIKILAEGFGDQDKEQLRREARIVARMDHPGIVPVFDLGEHEGEVFIVMALVKGRSLRELLNERELTLDEVLDIGCQVALALDYSHQRGVVHRDVKPENILLEAGPALRAKVMDFGIALGGKGEGRDGIVGTPAYLAPEQAQLSRVDRRADVYALGAVLYECCAGRPPFDDQPLPMALSAVVHDRPPRLQQRVPAVPAWLDSLVMRCLEKAPERRPQSARELSEALEVRGSTVRPLSVASPQAIHGREDVLRVLERRLETSTQGAELVLLGGSAGVGKTSVVDALNKLAKERDSTVIVGRCLDREDKVPYHGFCDAIAAYIDSFGGEPPSPLRALIPALLLLFPSLSHRVAMDYQPTLAADQPPEPGQADRSAVLELLAQTLRAISNHRPLVLTLEDMHDGGVSVEAVRYLHRRLAGEPILFVVTYQSERLRADSPLAETLADLHRDPKVLQLELGPLAPTALLALVEEVLEGSTSPDLVERLYSLSGGHPLYAQLLVQELKDTGGLSKEDGSWALKGGARVPESLKDLLGGRLSRLGSEARKLVTAGAVIGNFFSTEELAACTDAATEGSARDAVESGVLRRASRPGRDGFEFTSDLLRMAIYDDTGPAERRALHQSYANYMEQQYGGNPDALSGVFAHHFRLAGVYDKALVYGVLAAHQALEAGSSVDALRALDVVADLPSPSDVDPGLESHARRLRAQARRLAGDAASALTELEPASSERAASPSQATTPDLSDFASESAGAESSPEPKGDVLLAQGEYLAAKDAHLEALQALDVGRPLAAEDEARLLLRQARSAMKLGKYPEALKHCDAGRACLDAEAPLLAAEILACKSLCCSAAGLFEESHHAVREGFTLVAMCLEAEWAPRERVLAALHRSTGNMLIGRGRYDEAIDAYASGLELCEMGTDLFERSVARFNVGEALIAAGRLFEGVRHLEHAIEEKLDLGDHWGLAYAHFALAIEAIERGNLGVAGHHAEEGERHAHTSGDPKPIVMHRVLGGSLIRLHGRNEEARRALSGALKEAERIGAGPEILSARLELSALEASLGDSERALKHARIAHKLAIEWGSGLDRARALLARARALLLVGRTDDAATAIEEARGLFDENGNPYRVLDAQLAEVSVQRKRGEDVEARLAELRKIAKRLGITQHAELGLDPETD